MRILRLLIALLAIGGIVDSYLALRVHRQDPSVAPPCAVSEHWDCGTVNHSRYAVFPAEDLFDDPGTAHKGVHIPVAIIGIAGYALIALLAVFGAPAWMVMQAAEIGFFGAAVLSYLEAFVIDKWCIYCVWSQTIIATTLLLSIVLLVMERRRKRFEHSAVVVSR